MIFLKQNWFKLGLLISVLVLVLGFLVIDYKEYKLQRFTAERATIDWATANTGSSLNKLLGTKEIKNFKNHFWSLFNQSF